MDTVYDFAVWGTQGGGLVRRSGTRFIFVKKPDCPGFNVGDVMPDQWDRIPANSLARQQEDMDQEPLLFT